ncbi:MAG: alpha/beta hydrolase [Acidobacteriaceae bacterium]|nr:alpha/beta hydrolase [Acidobacteriaceae bacterium]
MSAETTPNKAKIVIREDDLHHRGQTIHYRVAGSGLPVILVHGYPESSRTWEKVMAGLADQYTVVAPDTRGTGSSSITGPFTIADVAEDIYALVKHLGFQKILIVGQDFGVQHVAAYASLHREDIRALAVMESPLSAFGLEELYASFWHFGFLASPYATMLLSGREREFFLQFAFGDFVHRKEAFTKSDLDEYIAAQQRPGRLDAGLAYYRALWKAREFFSQAVTPPWTFPVLALDGDHSMKGLTGKSFAQIAPNLKTVIVPDSGHFIQEEQPGFLLKQLQEFFKEA